MSKPLRKCNVCGLEAWIEEDLKLFRIDNSRRHGKRNQCKKCSSEYAKKLSEKHPLKNRYKDMVGRCYNSNIKAYKNYGGRGIYVCKEWFSNRQTFIDWAMNNGFKPELEIDRIDNDGPYAPWNCRWVTHQQQALNRIDTKTNLERRTRICQICKIEKPFKDYHRSLTVSQNKGYARICKPCKKIVDRKRYASKIKNNSL